MSIITTLARIGSAATLLAIVIAGVFGRKLQLKFPTLASYLPYIVLATAILALIVASISIGRALRNYRCNYLMLAFSVFFTAFLAAALIIICERSIMFPIERIHFIKYFSLGFLSFLSQKKNHPLRCAWYAFAFSAIVGSLEESLQFWHPERYYDIRDIEMNVVSSFFGAIYGLVIKFSLERTFRPKTAKTS